MDKIQKLKQLIDLVESVKQDGTGEKLKDSLMTEFFKSLNENIKQVKEDLTSETKSVNDETRQTIQEAVDFLGEEHSRLVEANSTTVSKITKAEKDIQKKLAKVEKLIQDARKAMPENGKDADEEIIIQSVLAKIELPEYKETILDNGDEIIKKVNESEKKIKAERIEGADKLVSKANMDRAISILDQRTQFLINRQSTNTGSSLPDQTGNNGKFLSTDGTDPAWTAIPGGGDMLASVYDPAGGSAQVAFAGDLATVATTGAYSDLSGTPTISDTAYNATSWNANTDGATKNAIRDKVDAMDTAIDLKVNTSLIGANNGVAGLDAGGKVPSSQLPSYVDDVEVYNQLSSFPVTGETGKIYVTEDTNIVYRWNGSGYTEISSSLALGETSATAYRGDRGKIAYDHSLDTITNPHAVTKTQVGLGNVDNTSDVNKPVSTAQATANTQDKARANHTGTQLASTISDFATAVRAVVLTGISFVTSTAVVAGDTILQALGKLQAQITLRASTSQIFDWNPFFNGTVANGDYRIITNASFAGTINEVTTKSVSGTATVTVKINTTALGGTANSASSTQSTQTHSSANTFAAGDYIVITVSSASALLDLSLKIKYTRTLA